MQRDTATGGESDADELMEALADDRRRRVLRALWDAGGAISLAELAEEISHRERAGEDVSPDPDRVEISLYHVHLPKLADAGLVVVAERGDLTRLRFTGTPEMRDRLSNVLALEGA